MIAKTIADYSREPTSITDLSCHGLLSGHESCTQVFGLILKNQTDVPEFINNSPIKL